MARRFGFAAICFASRRARRANLALRLAACAAGLWLAACASAEPTQRGALTPINPPSLPDATPVDATALPTARPRVFEDVDSRQILSALHLNLPLTDEGDTFTVLGNPDWRVWVNDRDEGRITGADRPELAALVSQTVGPNPPPEAANYGPSGLLLAIFIRDENTGELALAERAYPFGNVSPLAFDARLPRVVDVNHDGQDELLLVTSTVQTLIQKSEAQLVRWDKAQLTELWRSVIQSDNTAGADQAEYASYEASADFADLDDDGVDEIILSGSLTRYAKDANGGPILGAPSRVDAVRQVYVWNGATFILDAGRSNPPVPLNP
jgi:hypothetical protein